MRIVLPGALALLVACASAPSSRRASPPAARAASAPPATQAPRPPERLAADSPRTTIGGATFIAPAGWTIAVHGPVGEKRAAAVEPVLGRLLPKGYARESFAGRKAANPDRTVSFATIAPGIAGIELVVGAGEKRTLVLRDAQHEYVFAER